MPRRISITKGHIEESTQRDSSHCMIADAIKDTIPGVKRVSVDLATIRYTLKGKRYTFLTPRPAQVALLQFDQGEKLDEFTFRLGSPAQIIPSGGRPPKAGVIPSNKPKPAVRTGGKAMPTGPLAGGHVPAGELRTGSIRRYGLKAIPR